MDFIVPTLNIQAILPLIVLAVWGLILMFIDLRIPDERKSLTGWLSLVGIIPALIVAFTQWNVEIDAFFTQGTGDLPGLPLVLLDNFSTFLNILYLISAAISILIAVSYVRDTHNSRGELYFLMLFSTCGMMLMGMANDLILTFLALELLSIPLYILSGFDNRSSESEESALKYFLLGAFSSGFLVFGIALLYGATGSTALPIIAANISGSGALGMAGVAMLLVGFAFKIGAVPFHMWTPDVYEGAPTAVTAFMSVGSKVGGFAALLRIFAGSLDSIILDWAPAIAVIAAATMILGNIAAISQQNIKRMLAYSSIAHAGYILMAVVAGRDGVSAALYYMLAYLFTNLGAFACVIAVERNEGKMGLLLDDYKGLSKRNLPFAIALMYLMLSLTGIPLTAGFTGKFFVFRTTIDAGYVWLAVVGALTSVVSAYYYLRVVFYSFMYDGPAEVYRYPRALKLALGICVAAVLILGFVPDPWYDAASRAIIPTVTAVVGG